MQSNIDSTISILESYVGNNEYRSPTTGLTFNDLINEFTYLSNLSFRSFFRVFTPRALRLIRICL
ncbi:MAG: hypothetical protein L6V93_09400 [Clostridiales bacterium]|nr:MAG: hypothetical protein L6V93_09400 [Clostridiales bacterium]